jgi:hypothetical protein
MSSETQSPKIEITEADLERARAKRAAENASANMCPVDPQELLQCDSCQ